MYENPHCLVRRLAGSYEESSVKAMARISIRLRRDKPIFPAKGHLKSHQPEPSEVQSFPCVLLDSRCRFIAVVNTEIISSID